MATHDWTGTPTPPPLSLHKAVQRHTHPLFNATEMYRSRHTYVRSSGPSGIYGGKPNLPLRAPPLPRASLWPHVPSLLSPPPLQIRPGPKCLQPSSVSGMDGRAQSISKHAPRKELFFLLGRLCHRAPDENGAIVSTGEHVKRSKTLRIILERSTPPPYITH